MTAAYPAAPGFEPAHSVICRTWAPASEPLAAYIGFSHAECFANALLIAAAPEMLAALKALVTARGAILAGETLWEAALDAIAKAEGR